MLSTEMGLNKIIFEGNVKKVIDEINKLEESWTSYGQLLEDVKKFLQMQNKLGCSLSSERRKYSST